VKALSDEVGSGPLPRVGTKQASRFLGEVWGDERG
jgi:hypothetical protein